MGTVPDMPATIAGLAMLIVVAGCALTARLVAAHTHSRIATCATTSSVLVLLVLTGWNLYLTDWSRWAKVVVYAFMCLAIAGMARATTTSGGAR
jgi:hypothetical protein